MKLGVAIYHKNIERYPEAWISKCMQSIKDQVYQSFEVFELNYGYDIVFKWLMKDWFKEQGNNSVIANTYVHLCRRNELPVWKDF